MPRTPGIPMAFFVVRFEPKDLNRLNQELLTDMTVSKNSIHTRDGGSIGMDSKFLYLRVMGGEEKVAAACKLFVEKKFGEVLNDVDAKRVSQKIDEEEEAAAEGMGMIFGG